MASELSEDQQREIVGKYRNLREEVEALYAKVSQIDSDKSEHEYVLLASPKNFKVHLRLFSSYFISNETQY